MGCIVGSALGGLEFYEDGSVHMANKSYKRISPFFIPYAITNMASALVSMEENFMGPNYSINTACATGNNSIISSANHIKNGEADLIIAGGVDGTVTRVGLGGFMACRALANEFNQDPSKASRPWDEKRGGFVLGEGAGILILESLEHAEKRGANIIAEYLGGGMTCDAHHMTNPREDGLGVSLCLEKAIESAGIEKE